MEKFQSMIKLFFRICYVYEEVLLDAQGVFEEIE